VAGYCKHGNKNLCSLQCSEFLTSWATIRCSRRTLLHAVRLLYSLPVHLNI